MSIPRVKNISEITYRGIHEFLPYGKSKGHSVCIAYGRDQVKPWAVSYCGSDHFFATLPETLAYAAGRGWIPYHMIDAVKAVIEQKIGV